jgi:Flp pilus assembly protein TadG
MRRRAGEERAADRGVVSVLSVFFVLLLLTFLAVVINLGRLMHTRGDLQHAADSAALAAAGALDTGPGGTQYHRIAADFDDASSTSIQGTAVSFGRSYTMTAGVGQVATMNPVTDLQLGFWHLRGPELCAFGSGTACGPGWELAASDLKTNPIAMLSVNAAIAAAHYPLPAYFGDFLGLGTTDMTAKATAYGREGRVKCALPTAVNVCQLIGPGGTGFDCSSGDIDLTFVNAQDTVDPRQPQAFGRIDLINQWNPAEGIMRDYVRTRDYLHCEDDAADLPPTTEYLAGVGLMPNSTRGNIQPVIDALAGVPTDGGTHQAKRCLLGSTMVLPVVKPIGVESPADCANICPAGPDPGGCIAWPASGQQRVVGFVNVTFIAAHCWHEASPHPDGRGFVQPTLTQANCETELDPDPAAAPGELLATNCSGTNGMTPSYQAGLRVDVQISCTALVGPLGTTWAGPQPRLVR